MSFAGQAQRAVFVPDEKQMAVKQDFTALYPLSVHSETGRRNC